MDLQEVEPKRVSSSVSADPHCGQSTGAGAGEALVAWALAEARRRGCGLVQLTTDRSRHDAHRFYERLGFVASHVGYKLALDGS